MIVLPRLSSSKFETRRFSRLQRYESDGEKATGITARIYVDLLFLLKYWLML